MESADVQSLFDLVFVIGLFVAFAMGFDKGGQR